MNFDNQRATNDTRNRITCNVNPPGGILSEKLGGGVRPAS